MKVFWADDPWRELSCDFLIAPLFQDEDYNVGFPAEIDRCLDGLFEELRHSEEWTGKAGQANVVYRPQNLTARRFVLLGLGKKGGYWTGTLLRNLMVTVAGTKGFDRARVGVYLRPEFGEGLGAVPAVQGVVLGTFQRDPYKTIDRSSSFVEAVVCTGPEGSRVADEDLQRARILAEATNLARGLAQEPANLCTPAILAETALKMAKENGLEAEVWDEQELEKRRMRAILAVSRGSRESARFVILRHRGSEDSNSAPIVLAGKGVTFDSGGLSLKPADSMEEMKMDKAGACAVLGAMQAVAQLGVPSNVVGLLPCVENLPGPTAQRPGDILNTFSGKTVEVLNTDAEGRLILSDTLAYAARELQARCIIDIATLTGACIVALGHRRAGLFSNDDELCRRLIHAADQGGERLWRFPLDEPYREDIESEIADLKNVGGRYGGAITAAKFLEEFVDGVPWCHLDIAGVDLFKDDQLAKGPTGFGVRTLAETIRCWEDR